MSAAIKLLFLNIWLLIIEGLDIFNDSNFGNQQFFPFHSFQLPFQNSLEVLPNFATCLKVAYGLSKPRHALLWRNIVRNLAVGGSETAGVFCSEPHSQDKTCAWPSRFASWLRLQFLAIPIYLDNQATGGTSTAGSLFATNHTLADVQSDSS
jgi:hypothetical protein